LHQAGVLIYHCMMHGNMKLKLLQHFMFCWPCISVQFYLMTNMMHNSFFVYVYFNSLHVSSTQVLIVMRLNCINTISGICHSM